MLETDPTHYRVKLLTGVDKTVSLRDLAPLPKFKPSESVAVKPVARVTSLQPTSDLQFSVTPNTDNASFSDSAVTTVSLRIRW